MFKEGKYLIVLKHGIDLPILFHEILSHAECSPQDSRVVSAGSFRFYKDGTVDAYGKSTTLNIASRKQDADIITKEFFKEK